MANGQGVKPQLRRKSDNRLISDRCVSWARWQPAFQKAANQLISGDFHTETVGGRGYSGDATFKFDSALSTSTLEDQDLLEDMDFEGIPATYRDQRGRVYEVDVTISEIKPVEASRLREINYVTVSMRRGARLA